MKNVIAYYYDIHLNDIYQKDGVYRFSANGLNFAFLPFTRGLDELDDLVNLSRYLFNIGISVHQFVVNINNAFLTYISTDESDFCGANNNVRAKFNSSIPYVLLQIYNNERRKITIEDITSFSNKTYNIYNYNSLNRSNWGELWGAKIDYFEYQINQLGKNKPIIRDSFPYYSGIVENGIGVFNSLDVNYAMMSVQHKRIKKGTDVFWFYNPLNFVIDYRIRDACEYYKNKVLDRAEAQMIGDDILNFFRSDSLNKDEIYLFYARMLYPSFYFDKYENIIVSEGKDFEEIKDITSKYEKILKLLYKNLSNYIVMPDIWWLAVPNTIKKA